MLSYTCLSGFSQVRVRVNLNSAITDQLVVRPRIVQLGWILALGVYIVLAGNLIVSALIEQPPQDHYYYQAVSWLHGQLDIDNAPTWMQDIVTANGHRYLPLGPMPAVLALPLVAALGERYRDALLVYPLAGLTAFLAWRILKRLNVVRVEARLWLAALFILGTVYFSAAVQSSGAWFVAHIVTCFFLFLGIDEALGKKRPLVMGACLGLATAARFTALFTFPFFLILLSVNDSLQLSGDAAHNNRLSFPIVLRRVIGLGIGLALPMAALFIYNYARFHNFLDSGYGAAVLGGDGVLDRARAYGLFSLAHVPKNLYYFFLAVPDPFGPTFGDNPANSPVLTFPFLRPSPWGMSIFLTTPAVVYVVRARLRRPLVRACWAAILLCAVPIFTYYGVGWAQFGYRYALDFMPFLWLLIVIALRDRVLSVRQPSLALWLIAAGCVVNLWGAYWLPDIRGIAPRPVDSRVTTAPNDRLVIWCNVSSSPATLDVWGIDANSRGYPLTTFQFADLVGAGSSGVVQQARDNTSVRAKVDDQNNFDVTWYADAPDKPTFEKTFNCHFPR